MMIRIFSAGEACSVTTGRTQSKTSSRDAPVFEIFVLFISISFAVVLWMVLRRVPDALARLNVGWFRRGDSHDGVRPLVECLTHLGSHDDAANLRFLVRVGADEPSALAPSPSCRCGSLGLSSSLNDTGFPASTGPSSGSIARARSLNDFWSETSVVVGSDGSGCPTWGSAEKGGEYKRKCIEESGDGSHGRTGVVERQGSVSVGDSLG